jgi:p-aminobenzoyl-glutamate transporter AbgT
MLMISFAPFARLLAEFQGANPTATSVETLLNGLLPFNSNLNFALHIFNPYYRWLACTVALSAIAVFLIARQIAQRLRIFKNLA